MQADFASQFEERLELRLSERREPSPIDEMIRYHFGLGAFGSARRGKRLRPHVLLRVALTEGGLLHDALDAAVAIEILHNYSLVHDDIEDGDGLRHGVPSVWARFGLAHGVNAGDAMCALSSLALSHATASVSPERALAMTRALHFAHLAMCEGQGLDISFEERTEVSMAAYRAMIDGKTAALFSAAGELGALAAGAPPERVDAYARLCRQYGHAFQIQDDMLGAWGAPEVTGKPSGADIARRKWSFPIVWALETAPSAARDCIGQIYAARVTPSEEDVAQVVRALDQLGAHRAAERAHDVALEEAGVVAQAAGIDPDRVVRGFLEEGARRVA